MSSAEHALLVLTIDLDAVAANWRLLQAKAGAAQCAAVIKADAYGLGAARVVPVLAKAGCTHFFTATLDEGIAARRFAPQAEIFVLSGPVAGSEGEYAAHGLTPILNSPGQLAGWRAYARRDGRPLPAGLHVDTGMTRLGFDAKDMRHLQEAPALVDGVNLVLGMTHLACADTPDHPLNVQQLQAFRQTGWQVKRRSIAASSGIFLGADYHFDLVRPGAALYGINPTQGRPNPMQPAVRLQGRILQVRDVDLPQTVGYGATHSIAAPGRIATVAAGYADGYCRALSNRGLGIIAGVTVPMVGRVSMDLITFDVSALPTSAVQEGDLIDLIGPSHDVDALAAEAGTIGYEILTQLPRRAVRHYIGGAL